MSFTGEGSTDVSRNPFLLSWQLSESDLPFPPQVLRRYSQSTKGQGTLEIIRPVFPLLRIFRDHYNQLFEFDQCSQGAPVERVIYYLRKNVPGQNFFIASHNLLRTACVCLEISNTILQYLALHQQIYSTYEAGVLERDPNEISVYVADYIIPTFPAEEIRELKDSMREDMRFVRVCLQRIASFNHAINLPGREFYMECPQQIKIAHGYPFLRDTHSSTWEHEPPTLRHPIKKVPGTDWSKFLGNVDAPLFGLPNLLQSFVIPKPQQARKLTARFTEIHRELRIAFGEVSKIF